MVKVWRYDDIKYGMVNADDIARRSRVKNNPKVEMGNFFVFFFPSFRAKDLSLIIDAVELTMKVKISFPINGSTLFEFSKNLVDKFEVA